MLANDPQLVRKVKAAITAKIKPTSMVLMESPDEPWRLLDFQLIEAFQILQDEICPQCGHPVWLCRNNSEDLIWKVVPAVCQGTAEVEKQDWQKNNPGARPKAEDRASWGRVFHPVPEMIHYPGEEKPDLPTREEFYAALAVE